MTEREEVEFQIEKMLKPLMKEAEKDGAAWKKTEDDHDRKYANNDFVVKSVLEWYKMGVKDGANGILESMGLSPSNAETPSK